MLEVINTEQSTIANANYPELSPASAASNLAEAINTVLPDEKSPLSAAARLHFQNLGKLLRGTTSLRLAKVVGLDWDAAINWAVAVELMHNASLVHDDICDEDQFRRDQFSVVSSFGTPIAVCLGDWLVARSFELGIRAAEKGIGLSSIELLASSMRHLSAGEAAEFSSSKFLDWSDYEKIVLNKTVPLISAAIEGPLVLSDRKENLSDIRAATNALGIAYQISNDISDIIDGNGNPGPFNDLRKRAPNAVLLTFREQLSTEERNDYDVWWENLSGPTIEEWIVRIHSSQSLDICSRRLNSTLGDFKDSCNNLPDYILEALDPIIVYLQALTSTCAPLSKKTLDFN